MTPLEFYSTRQWRKARELAISLQPFCVICLKNESLTPAESVDHIQAFTQSDLDTWNTSILLEQKNLQPLCNSCHFKKTKNITEYFDKEGNVI